MRESVCFFKLFSFAETMPPINESSIVQNGTNSEEDEASSSVAKDEGGPRKFTFPSHQFHMVTLARMCQENKDYTDCVIKIDEEELRAHRLVLGSVSPFLKLVFSDIPSNLSEATILVPGVKKRVVKALLDFFYTGQMMDDHTDTSELQLLSDTMQNEPGQNTGEAVTEETPKEPTDTKEEESVTATEEQSVQASVASGSRKRRAEGDIDVSSSSSDESKKPNLAHDEDKTDL